MSFWEILNDLCDVYIPNKLIYILQNVTIQLKQFFSTFFELFTKVIKENE